MRRRKLLRVILALSLCLTLPLGMAAAEETAGTATVQTAEELTKALADSANAVVKLTADITIGKSLTVSRTVTLDLNGYVLKMTNNGGSVIYVADKGHLKLTDSTPTAEHRFTPDENGLWALDEEKGTKTVTGGVITGGTGTHDTSGTNEIRGGGGVYVDGGGQFTMNGGNIAGCTVQASKGLALGGGVYVAKDGKFTMTDGSIAGCTAQATDHSFAYGGGIRKEGTTTLFGNAEIRDCRANKDYSSASAGGGISDGGNGKTLTISGNVTVTGCAADGKSDAVFLLDDGSISGGTFDGSVTNYGKITGGTFNGTVTGSGSISGATVVASVSDGPEFLAALADRNVTTIKQTNHITVEATDDVKELTIDRAITLVNGSRASLQLYLPLTIAKDGALTLDGLEGVVDLNPYNGMVVNGSLTVGANCGVSFGGENASLVINAGGTVTTQPAGENTNPGQLSLEQGATLTVNAGGKVDNQGRLSVSDVENLKKAADIGGDLTLDGVTIDEDYTLDMKGDLLTIRGSLDSKNNANLTVVNASKVDATHVTLSSGSYYCPVTAGGDGEITGGSFYGPVTVKFQGSSEGKTPTPISGGTFYGELKGASAETDYSIQGRKVTYMDGEDVYAIQVVRGKASAPDAPSKDGYALAGWYTEAGEKFDFEKDTVTEDITLTARWSKNAPGVSYASLRFETGGGSALPALSLPYGSAVDLTKYVPSREGFTFTGWYTDRELTKRVTSLTLTNSTVVYAGWNPFTDAGSGDWYYEDVLYVYNRGLMEGTGADTFSPDGAVTRGQIVTILWRLAGSPVVNFAMDFTDVTEETWCAEAIRWAAAEGIAQGFDDGSFGQDRVVTREQLAAFLYREVQRQGGGFTGMWYFPLNYPDIEALGEFADEAMHWCVMTGVLQGTADGRLAPKDTADRAQLSAILHRYLTVEK